VVQVLDILVGTLPATLLGLSGFRNNGGCSCGCGVACPSFHRWMCPDDSGFACRGAMRLDNPPFFGDPLRVPPCLLQSEVTTKVIIWMFYVPALFAAIASFVLSTMSMTEDILAEVRQQMDARLAGNCRVY
jgi:Na+/melibiose symporter-like transporter